MQPLIASGCNEAPCTRPALQESLLMTRVGLAAGGSCVLVPVS